MATAVVSAEISISHLARATVAASSGGWASCAAVAGAGLSERWLSGRLGMTLTGAQKSIVVAAEEAGERLDRVLARHTGELSRNRLKALIEDGAVVVGGRTIRDPNHRVNSGSTIV